MNAACVVIGMLAVIGAACVGGYLWGRSCYPLVDALAV